MGTREEGISVSENNNVVEQSVVFKKVTNMAAGWMLDFMFVRLCRYFQEENFEQFADTLSIFEGEPAPQTILEAIFVNLEKLSLDREAISGDLALNGEVYREKTLICAFIARVMHGKELDVQFEDDDSLMPLMSAAKVWQNLKETVADETVFQNVTILLFVQAVALCLEKGEKPLACTILKWFENNFQLPENVAARLTNIVSQSETNHTMLKGFSFSHLVESVKSFLDAYLKKNPSDYLLKKATEMVLTSQNGGNSEDEETTRYSSHTSNASDSEREKNKDGASKKKRKLMSTKLSDLWQPQSSRKPSVTIKRLPEKELAQLTSKTSTDTVYSHKKRQPNRKWTWEMDALLKAGVTRHGLGKWSRILLDYDFDGRTGTMLKDRWRTLVKLGRVN